MQHITRRSFLTLCAQGAGMVAFSSMLSPRLLMAQSPTGTNKNFVIINLYGGMDGLSAMPYFSGSIADLLNTQLRPTLAANPASVIPALGQEGSANKIGFHPALKPLTDVALSKLAIVQSYGIPGDPGRSHDTCQILMSLGAAKIQGTEMVGFLARLMDLENWESYQYWAFNVENNADINTKKNPPIILNDLASLSFPRAGWESERETAFAAEIAESLVQVRTSQSGLGKLHAETSDLMHKTIALVKNNIASQIVGNNVAGNYNQTPLGKSLRDVAKIIKAKKSGNTEELTGKDNLFLLGQGGYDTHSDQNNPDSNEGNIAGQLGGLGSSLAVFYKDLEAMGALDDTVIVVYSEFGRTCYENGTSGNLSVGTDHGHASNTFILGGPVRAGVYGDLPTSQELSNQDYNALLPKVDFRDIFADVLQWLNVTPSEVFTDDDYHRQTVGFLQT